jgi:hypothetical protein
MQKNVAALERLKMIPVSPSTAEIAAARGKSLLSLVARPFDEVSPISASWQLK